MSYNDISQRVCPICGNRSGNVMGKLNYALFDDLDMPGVKTLIGCNRCGMLYDDVAFTEDQLQEYYRRNEHYAASFLGGTGSPSEDNNRRYDRVIDQLHAGANDLILDYGCGQGGFMARCRARGLRAAGIESSARSCRIAAASGLDVCQSPEEFAKRHADPVYAVVFSHILEHLLDPLQTLRRAVILSKSNLFYIEVPDADIYLTTGDVHWNEMYFEHLNHFRPETLHSLAANVPLDIISENRAVFSPELKDIGCLTLMGSASNSIAHTKAPMKPDNCNPLTFPFSPPRPDIPDGPLAIWGISQYAMLLLGTVPDLFNRTVRLFDASPAKIGRAIRNLKIEPSENLTSLDDRITLLIPRSKYLDRMLEEARQKSFHGLVLVV